MPDRLRAAFGPPRLGGYLSDADLTTFNTKVFPFILRFTEPLARSTTWCGKAGKTPGGIGFVLNSLVLFFKQKER